MDAECVFCQRLTRGEYDSETEWAVSFEPLNPVVPGHRLFVPKEHVRDAAESPTLTGHTMKMASNHANDEGDDFNLITSGGTSATQTVFHLHIHYVPRKAGDGLKLPWTNQRAPRLSDVKCGHFNEVFGLSCERTPTHVGYHSNKGHLWSEKGQNGRN